MTQEARPAAQSKLSYRPEIDGIRAIAVVSVVLLHAGVTLLGGGYIGVDIFFVISGFLITSILMRELDSGRFSILAFYERRARRILPALVFMVLVSWPILWAIMLPSQRVSYSESIASVALFISNLLFGANVGYFAPGAAERPLLHTWSLSVEEQYYVLFPLLLLFLWRFGRRVPAITITVLAVASLALAEYGAREDPTVSFFFTGTRAWELLAGAICAMIERRWGRFGSDRLALLGMAMMLGPLFLFTEDTPTPSLFTLIPVAGTALVLLTARQGGRVAAVLASRSMVGIGLISYSAYLWHQPLFTIARLGSDAEPPLMLMLGLVGVTFGFAWLSWRYVETPFRHSGRPLRHRWQVFAASGAALAVTLVLGVGGWLANGNLDGWLRANPDLAPTYVMVTEARKAHGRASDHGPCVFNIKGTDAPTISRIEACARTSGPALVVLGDSHGIDVYSAIAGFAGPRFVLGVTGAGCRPSAPKAKCIFTDFAALVAQRPELFAHVLFVQAGAPILLTPEGRPGSRQMFMREAPDATLPEFAPDMEQIRLIGDFLAGMSGHLPVSWLAPRIEPHVPARIILRRGCAAQFVMRPNQRGIFERLDRAIAAEVAGKGLPHLDYIALTDLPRFDMARDFISCDAALWSDGDHWSPTGESHFGGWLRGAGLSALSGF